MIVNADALADSLAVASGIPRYQVAALLAYIVDVVRWECEHGGTVTLPNLGAFAGRVEGARPRKLLGFKWVITPAQTRLIFRPKKSAKWL